MAGWVLCVYRRDCDEVGVVFTEESVTRWMLSVSRRDCEELGVEYLQRRF